MTIFFIKIFYLLHTYTHLFTHLYHMKIEITYILLYSLSNEKFLFAIYMQFFYETLLYNLIMHD